MYVPINLLLTAVLSLFLKMQRYHRMLGVVRVVICWRIFSAAHLWLLHKAAAGNRTSCQLNRWVGMPYFAVREPIQGWRAHTSSVQFSSRWYLCAQKSPSCAPPHLSEVSPTLPVKRFQCSSDWRRPCLVPHRALPLSMPFSSRQSMKWCLQLCARK